MDLRTGETPHDFEATAIKRILFLLALLALAGVPARAGSWAQGRGHFYAKLYTSYLTADQLAVASGEKVSIPDYQRHEAGLYLEYGLTDRWTLLVDAPLYRNAELEGIGESTGVGDLRLGVQRQLGRHGAWVFAGRLVVQTPTGDDEAGGGFLPNGSGVWEAEAWLSAGRSWAGGRWYGFFELGPQVRGGGFADGIVHRTQVGLHATRHLLLAFNAWGVEPFEQRGPGDLSAVTGLVDGVRYLAYGPSASYELPGGWGVQLDFDDADRIRNFASGPTVRLGISLHR